MEKGILHLHLTVIIIFILTYTFKTLLLLGNNFTLLDKVRSKTKIFEMVIGTLIIITGGGLLIITKSIPSYMVVKLIAVFAAIPMGIVGLKKNNKVLSVVALVLFIYVYGVAETNSATFNIGREKPASGNNEESINEKNNHNSSTESGKQMYAKHCISCHGPNGNLNAGGSKDLSKSTLTNEEKSLIIANGKGLMASFKYDLSEKEIEQVVQYINTFKK